MFTAASTRWRNSSLMFGRRSEVLLAIVLGARAAAEKPRCYSLAGSVRGSTTPAMTSLAEALEVTGGIVCAVGAGGKKSLLYALAASTPGRVGLTTTVHTASYPQQLGARVRIDHEAALRARLPAAAADGITAYACPSDKPGRHAGLAPELIADIHTRGGFALSLVKADGARMRAIKAPKPGEPVLVTGASRVLAVVSAAAIGQPLNEKIAHRPERLAALWHSEPGAAITPEQVGHLMASYEGLLKGCENIPVTVVVNQVDNDEREALARAAAMAALAARPELRRVVLTCLRDTPRVVAVIEAPPVVAS